GDWKEMAKGWVPAPKAWEAPRAKFKRPGEWVVAMLRAAGITPPDIGPVMQAHNLLGEPLWRPPAPNGFADESAPWLDGLTQRLDIANQFARRLGAEADPREVFEQALVPLASTHPPPRKPPAGVPASVHGPRIPAPTPPASPERGEPMTFTPPAAPRRELLLASGTLFAWAYLPKVARAEGRDPRLLVIVLRGALDG